MARLVPAQAWQQMVLMVTWIVWRLAMPRPAASAPAAAAAVLHVAASRAVATVPGLLVATAAATRAAVAATMTKTMRPACCA